MLNSILYDYSDAYILLSETISIAETSAADEAANNINKKLKLKNFASFTDCISKINNTQVVGNAKDIDIVMLMYKLI